jgi:cobalt/nickel transport system permease protein
MVGKFAVEAFHEIERTRQERGSVPSVARLGVVVAFLLTVVSFGKYELASLSALVLYPVSLVCFERVPLLLAFSRYWFLLLPALLLGAANPFFDREIVARICGVCVSGGWLSFCVLVMKGALALAVAWSLLRKIGVDGLTRAFASLRLPPSFGMAVPLTHRYLVLMIKETERMRDAYRLRSGRGTGSIAPSSWGPFVGLLLMRSMDRASNVQSAMELRGGVMSHAALKGESAHGGGKVGILYFAGWASYFIVARFMDPMRRLGEFVREVAQ